MNDIDIIKKIYQMKTIAVVGASRERILPLKVALNSGLVNVLITDHITAELLLSEE